MPYTIKPKVRNDRELQRKLLRIRTALCDRLAKDGRFTARVQYADDCLEIRNVRLTQKKEYCGQHPGPCQVSFRKKPNATWLEWEDWIQFNNMVNRVLNKLRYEADVWSVPKELMDRGGKFWIRRGKLGRVRYDWKNKPWHTGRTIQVWNHGTPDQFERSA